MDTPMGNTYETQRSRQMPSSSGYETSSVSSAGSTQTLLPPPSTIHPLTAARTLPDPTPQLLSTTRSPVGFGAPDMRYHPYAASSGSPSSVSGSLAETGEHYATAGISPTQITGGSHGPQKRAYRQRRKDPSCDACRERKVKCDATETSSCSECSSRGVKCQFTKETNRRMSSIKQVQDLQNQLAEAKQQISSLRSMLGTAGQEAGRGLPPSGSLSSFEQHRGDRKMSSPAVPGFEEVRRNLQKYSRGVFKLPPTHRRDAPGPQITTSEPSVPPTNMVEELLSTFHNQVHRQAPMIHWPSFLAQWYKVRDTGHFYGVPQTWVALFFIVLACGTLQGSKEAHADIDGMRFYLIAARLLNTWTDNIVVDHARATLLVSVFLYEQNVRSAAWVWLGTAMRMSQEAGLECTEGPWSDIEREGRQRTYWAIVSWDRLLALQENKTFSESMGESEAPWPTAVGDHWLQPRGTLRPPENVPGFSTVGIIIPVVRFVSQLIKSLRAKTITREVLQTYDDYFRNMNHYVPDQLQLESDSWLEPFVFSSIVPLLMVRFQLYRHNLNAYATAYERHEALERCHSVSVDTVNYLRRTMRPPPATAGQSLSGRDAQTWQQLLIAIAHNMLCRHVWRCTLMLCLRGDFAGAITCIQFSKAIGSTRKMNIACGRNLAFFLDRLFERTTRGVPQHELETDLEMIAYASGDLQGSLDGGFVWAGVQSDQTEATNASRPSDSNLRGLLEAGAPPTALLTDDETSDWGGWERVEHQVSTLVEEQKKRQHIQHGFRPPNQSHSPVYHRSAHNETKRVQLAPPDSTPSPGGGTTTGANSTRANTPPTGASRISIANII